MKGEAFSVSATSATGYSTQGVPTGRYFAPAHGPDCIEPDDGADVGDCGTRSLVVTGPVFQQHDSSYEVTGFTGTNTSRVIQLVSRINW